MSWGIQRKSGITVRELESPTEVTEATYTPVTFDDDGAPVKPATVAEPDRAQPPGRQRGHGQAEQAQQGNGGHPGRGR